MGGVNVYGFSALGTASRLGLDVSPLTVTAGSSVRIAATLLEDAFPNAPLAGRDVTLKITGAGADTYEMETVLNGQAVKILKPNKVGSYAVVATFAGDSGSTGTTVSASFVVVEKTKTATSISLGLSKETHSGRCCEPHRPD